MRNPFAVGVAFGFTVYYAVKIGFSWVVAQLEAIDEAYEEYRIQAVQDVVRDLKAAGERS